MKILITGAAGFIGTHLLHALHKKGHDLVGLDNLNEFSDGKLKLDRLKYQGIKETDLEYNNFYKSTKLSNYRFIKLDLSDLDSLSQLFKQEQFHIVCNLGAQAGVRTSIDFPQVYIESNLIGFHNILECCRNYPVQHLLYASSSSVYGANTKTPYAESDKTDQPMSLYAATKKSNELMAYSYSSLFGIPATGLRFFTVYGPWGRTNMAPFIFMKSIYDGKPIQIFNQGKLSRDFTYIDDIVEGIVRVMDRPPRTATPHAVYNIGHAAPVPLMDFISTIEKVMNKKAIKEYLPMQAGDVHTTYADTSALQKEFHYSPSTDLEEGIQAFYNWFISYYENR